jgi:hypothetical protein
VTKVKLLKDFDGLIIAEIEENERGQVISVKTWDDDLNPREWMEKVSNG